MTQAAFEPPMQVEVTNVDQRVRAARQWLDKLGDRLPHSSRSSASCWVCGWPAPSQRSEAIAIQPTALSIEANRVSFIQISI